MEAKHRNKQENSVCLFCGSRPGEKPEYVQLAEQFGQSVASEGWRLVYGGGDGGLMGAAASAALDRGGKVLGIIPQHLPEQALAKLDFLIVTEGMQQRKHLMLINSDAFVVFPGGFGTIDEFSEIITLKQLGYHNKPVLFLSPSNYWSPFLSTINRVINEGFAEEDCTSLFETFTSSQELLNRLRRYFSSLNDSQE